MSANAVETQQDDENDDDCIIAADLTLYSNPVHRALHGSVSRAPNGSYGPSADKLKLPQLVPDNDDAVIASDMTKYDSPMAEFDMSTIDKSIHTNLVGVQSVKPHRK